MERIDDYVDVKTDESAQPTPECRRGRTWVKPVFQSLPLNEAMNGNAGSGGDGGDFFYSLS